MTFAAIWAWIVGFVPMAVQQGVPLLFGSTGEIITEKSGNLNLGIPGIMYMGGVSGVIGAFFYEQTAGENFKVFWGVMIPLLSALVGAGLLAFIYSFLTITLRANQNVTGLALTTLGCGIGDFFGGSLAKMFGSGGMLSVGKTSQLFKKTLPFGQESDFGKLFLSYGFLTYTAVIVALIAAFYLKRTRSGLNLRAVGENPATADAAGISVTRYKYLSTIFGGMIAGLGGLYYIADYSRGIWDSNGFGDRGWLAIALVIFALWKPGQAIWGSFLFGGLYMLPAKLNLSDNRALHSLVEMIPYAMTIVVLIITSMRKKREHQPPQALGLPYFREER